MLQQACPFQDAQRPLLFPSLSDAYHVDDLHVPAQDIIHQRARRLITSRTFTQMASFLPSFKEKYTAFTEHVLEECKRINQMWQEGPSPHRLLMTMFPIVTDNRACASLLLRQLPIGEMVIPFSRAVSCSYWNGYAM